MQPQAPESPATPPGPPDSKLDLSLGLSGWNWEQITVPVALAAAIIGLFAVIMGSLIGAFSATAASRRQIDHQARQWRGRVYGDYLSAYLTGTIHSTGQLFHAHRAKEISAAISHSPNRFRDRLPGITRRSKFQRIVTRDLAAALRENVDKMNESESLASQSLADYYNQEYRVKVFAPPLVHEVADLLGELQVCQHRLTTSSSQDLREELGDWRKGAMSLFADLARADVRSPGSRRWRGIRRDSRRFINQCRDFISDFDEREPLMLMDPPGATPPKGAIRPPLIRFVDDNGNAVTPDSQVCADDRPTNTSIPPGVA